MAAVADVDSIVQQLKRKIELSGELHAHDLDALGAWLDRAGRMGKAVLDARVDVRRVQISERDAERVADVMAAILTDLGHSLQDDGVMQVVSRRMLELAE